MSAKYKPTSERISDLETFLAEEYGIGRKKFDFVDRCKQVYPEGSFDPKPEGRLINWITGYKDEGNIYSNPGRSSERIGWSFRV